MKNNINIIEEYLDELYINPKCELEYSKDYELLINIMLSSQTTDKKVNSVSKELYHKYDSLDKLNEASIESIKNIIRPLGIENIKANNIKDITYKLINDYNYKVPKDINELIKMKGIGRKVALVFLIEYYKENYIPVDTHVNRVSKRLGLVNEKDSSLVIENKLKEVFNNKNLSKRHLQMVLFGRYNCKSINPNCFNCKLKDICNYNK